MLAASRKKANIAGQPGLTRVIVCIASKKKSKVIMRHMSFQNPKDKRGNRLDVPAQNLNPISLLDGYA